MNDAPWQRLERAVSGLQTRQATLRQSLRGFRTAMSQLRTEIDRLGVGTRIYHHSLVGLGCSIHGLGRQSQLLGAMMTDYLDQTDGREAVDAEPVARRRSVA